MPKHTEEVLMKLSCMLSVLPLPERILFLLACLVNSLPNPHQLSILLSSTAAPMALCRAQLGRLFLLEAALSWWEHGVLGDHGFWELEPSPSVQ